MNLAHLHLLLNHIPIVGMGFGSLLLLVAIVRKSEELKRASLWAFVVLALLALPVFFTGEPAEKVVEHLPEVSETFVEAHEDFAQFALIGIEILGFLSLAGWLIFRGSKAFPSWLATVAFFLSLAISGMMAWTGHLGGMIRHTETRSGFQASSPGAEGSHAVPRDSTPRKSDED